MSSFSISNTSDANIIKSSKHVLPASSDYLIPDAVLSVFETTVEVWLNLFVCLIGIVANVIEICVFTKQGFKDTVNISMTFIAFWDLVRVIVGAGHRFHGPISLVFPGLAEIWGIATKMTAYSLHNLFSNVCYVLATIVSVERCLSVSMPLKVKYILTSKTTTMACAVISLLVFSSLILTVFIFDVNWVYGPQNGTNRLVYTYTEFYKVHGAMYSEASKVFGFGYPVISLTTMVVSTIIISHHLKKSAHFRLTTKQSKNRNGKVSQAAFNTKEKQIVKMLLVIIYVYIINLIPRVCNFIIKYFQPEYDALRFYNNIYRINVDLVFFLDFVNATVHVFIFYTMSSKFRKTFDAMFKFRRHA